MSDGHEERPVHNALEEYLQQAHQNTFASVQNEDELGRLGDIATLYFDGRDALDNYGKNPLVPAFYLMAYSSFLAGVRLASSGQTPEAYTVLRGCIERSLYGLHVSRSPALAQVWLERGQDDASKKAVRDEFSYGKVSATLHALNSKLGEISHRLYEQTIDDGGHPNARAYLGNIEHNQEDDGKITFELNILNPGSDSFRLALKTCSRVGAVSLHIFKEIFALRFDLLGISERLERVSRGL
jgi:hypothetical protein